MLISSCHSSDWRLSTQAEFSLGASGTYDTWYLSLFDCPSVPLAPSDKATLSFGCSSKFLKHPPASLFCTCFSLCLECSFPSDLHGLFVCWSLLRCQMFVRPFLPIWLRLQPTPDLLVQSSLPDLLFAPEHHLAFCIFYFNLSCL